MKIGMVIFRGWELMDSGAPFSFLMRVANRSSTPVEFLTIAEKIEPQRSTAHLQVIPTHNYSTCPQLDVIVIPGGVGTLEFAHDLKLRSFLKEQESGCKYIMSVCTGSSILATAGFLDGRKATSNKAWFDLQTLYGKNIEWMYHARYVIDGKFITASGVSAGVDAGVALSGLLFGEDLAKSEAELIKYSPVTKDNDPFANVHKRQGYLSSYISYTLMTNLSQFVIPYEVSHPSSKKNKSGVISCILFPGSEFLEVVSILEACLAARATHWTDLVSVGVDINVKCGSGKVDTIIVPCDRHITSGTEPKDIFIPGTKLVIIPTVENADRGLLEKVTSAVMDLEEDASVLVCGMSTIRLIAPALDFNVIKLEEKGWARHGKWIFAATGSPALSASLNVLQQIAGVEKVRNTTIQMELTMQ